MKTPTIPQCSELPAWAESANTTASCTPAAVSGEFGDMLPRICFVCSYTMHLVGVFTASTGALDVDGTRLAGKHAKFISLYLCNTIQGHQNFKTVISSHSVDNLVNV